MKRAFLLLLVLLEGGSSAEVQCGTRAVSQSVKIIGGSEAPANKWPWQGHFISYNAKRTEAIHCGASLITNNMLITAAHCVKPLYSDSYVLLGSVLSNQSPYVYRVAQKYVHESYDDDAIINDIALLLIDRKVTFSDSIRPICTTANDAKLITGGTTAYVTGFGYTLASPTDPNLETPSVLMEASLPIIDHSVCVADWLRFGGIRISNAQVCAGAYFKGTAPGDSGGPLQVQGSDNRWYLVGLTSFGADSFDGLVDQGSYPGVYTRVSSYLSWVENAQKTYSATGDLSTDAAHSNLYSWVLLVLCIFQASIFYKTI